MRRTTRYGCAIAFTHACDSLQGFCGIRVAALRSAGLSPAGSEGFVNTGSFHTSLVVAASLIIGGSSAALAQQPDRPANDRQSTESQRTDRQSGEAQTSERESGRESARRIVGTVTSIGRGSVVVRTDLGRYVVYTLDPDTQRPASLAVGTRVSVVTYSDDRDPSPIADRITVLPRPQGLAEANAEPEPVPPEVRRLERQIERQARRYRAGVQVGAALDPELVSLDVFSTLGPFFSRNAYFRPNLEFAWGEVTTLFGVHLDGIYTLPGVTRSMRWAPYVGTGPTFSFSHRGFEGEEDGQRFDFGEFEWHNGVNFIVGARNPNGAFFEMKSTAWGAANVRLLGGFEF